MVWAIWEDAMTESVSGVPARVSDAAIGRVLDDLLLAGRSADELAAWLSNLGCWGNVTDPHACPVAHYFRKRLPLGWCTVYATEARLQLVDGREVCIVLPPHVPEFIHAFDNRRYPELIGNMSLTITDWATPQLPTNE